VTEHVDLTSDGDFARWNEEMVRRYDIERYYTSAHPLVRWIERRRIDALVALAAPTVADRVLEVGCGAGHVLERFGSLDRIGLDLSEEMLRRCRLRVDPGVPLARGSAEQLPFAAASFDIVVCTEVLEHTRDPERVVRELMRVARPRARVVVSIPNEGNIDRAKRTLRRMPVLRDLLSSLAAEENEWHLHRFDPLFLRRTVGSSAVIAAVRGIPNRLLAVRYAALLRHS
jgi:ubiquinone/menaquinone biosynthesis C-methylase UbiE